ncbi:hypothetical protein HY218_01305 [Candidatus Saccharibacteria bacterium]|nr:hypothetical protein [Candidatus Saccharibacteria bacterium]
MTAINHALTGAVIGFSLHQPLLAIPVAFISHFVLDGLPHMGGMIHVGSQAFRWYLLADASLCTALVGALVLWHPHYWQVASISAFVATSPDFMWLPQFLAAHQGKSIRPSKHWLVQLHERVQWFDRPIGAIVEIVWAVAVWRLLATFLFI